MSIRLICSDIDGTLLQYGKKELENIGVQGVQTR